jgi:cyclopropane-fatty-acyl-phospholipid synthase
MSKLAKKLISNSLSKLISGQIVLQDQNNELTFGQGGGLSATLSVNNPTFYSKIMRQGSLGAAKSYIDGDWQTDNLRDLIRIMIQNEQAMGKLDSIFSKIPQLFSDILAKIERNTINRSQKHIHAHYDLGNAFFQSFLDESLMYSCALFESAEDSLVTAQQRKLAKITELLDAQSNDHILEIGTGWGSMAIYLAQTVGCHVTTTTISDEQYQYVSQRIHDLNLENKITLLKQDYRKLAGQFDKVVSIEMIEAVGHQYFDLFFTQCDRLLKPDGLLVIQAITMNEQNYERAKEHVDFIKKYIFPGGCLPSIHRISKSIANQTQLQWISLTDIGKHYGPTLRHWCQRFLQNRKQVRQLGFSDEFIRLWEYYFCYCEAGFEERYISDVQLLWKKRC